MAKFKIIPIFVPHKGCPHQCSFCNQKHITGQLEEMTSAKAHEIIELYLSTIDTQKFRTEIAFYGGSFTAIDLEYQNSLLEVAYEYMQKGYIKGIRLSTRPDSISMEILDNLKRFGVTEIELGVQSMCDNVLFANERGHTAKDVERASALIKKHGFELGLQIMTGLYADDDSRTASRFCRNNNHLTYCCYKEFLRHYFFKARLSYNDSSRKGQPASCIKGYNFLLLDSHKLHSRLPSLLLCYHLYQAAA